MGMNWLGGGFLLNKMPVLNDPIFFFFFEPPIHKDSTYADLDYNALIDDDGDYQNFYTNGINYDLTTEKTHIPGLKSNQ